MILASCVFRSEIHTLAQIPNEIKDYLWAFFASPSDLNTEEMPAGIFGHPRPVRKPQDKSKGSLPQTESASLARCDKKLEMEKAAQQVERRRCIDAINNAGAPPQGSARGKLFWAASIIDSLGLPKDKKGLRELQKRTHPDKSAAADRADANKAFQVLDHIEEGLRNGNYL